MWNLFEKIINALKPPEEPEQPQEDFPPIEQNDEQQQQTFDEAPQETETVAAQQDNFPDF
jgi:hypothetical protein